MNIGVFGESGVGKTTFTQILRDRYKFKLFTVNDKPPTAKDTRIVVEGPGVWEICRYAEIDVIVLVTADPLYGCARAIRWNVMPTTSKKKFGIWEAADYVVFAGEAEGRRSLRLAEAAEKLMKVLKIKSSKRSSK